MVKLYSKPLENIFYNTQCKLQAIFEHIRFLRISHWCHDKSQGWVHLNLVHLNRVTVFTDLTNPSFLPHQTALWDVEGQLQSPIVLSLDCVRASEKRLPLEDSCCWNTSHPGSLFSRQNAGISGLEGVLSPIWSYGCALTISNSSFSAMLMTV